MIIFSLECDAGHRFEGWFGAAGEFDQQKGSGLLTCPICDSHEIEKVLDGGAFVRSTGDKGIDRGHRQVHAEAPPVVVKDAPVAAIAPGAPPARPNGKLTNLDPAILVRLLHHHVQKQCENVGKRFYREAVKIHHGEAPARPIVGEATAEQREKLDDLEIPYAMLPKLDPSLDN